LLRDEPPRKLLDLPRYRVGDISSTLPPKAVIRLRKSCTGEQLTTGTRKLTV